MIVAGLALGVLALLNGWWSARGGTRRAACHLDRAWLDFRDAFGAMWGLRVIERMNDLARRQRTPIRLTWWGFRDPDRLGQPLQLEHALETVLTQGMRNVLRRFVSEAWLVERLGPDRTAGV